MAYAFDLRQVCGGYAYFSTFTLAHSDQSRRYETRIPSEVDRHLYQRALAEIGQKANHVDSQASRHSWLCMQGWALVDEAFARASMQQWLKQHECIKSAFGSFTDVSIASASILKRSLRGRRRQQVLDRDGNRCLLCDSGDQLSLQHVWPFSAGGETSARNLVTLCEECNQELRNEIHIDLYRFAGLPSGLEPSLLTSSDLSERAISRARHLSANMMHTRCDLW